MENGTHNHYFRRKLIIFLVIIVLAILFWSSAELQKFLSDSTFFAGQYLERYPFTGIMVFWAISTLSAILSPFSSIPFVPVAIAVWGNITTALILLSGWISGAMVSYFLGSSTGYVLAQKIFSLEKAKYYKQKLSAQAKFLTVLVFRLAIPTEIAGYVLGTIKYDLVKYFIATVIAEIPFALIVVYSGEAFMEANKIRFVFLIFLALVLMSAMFFLFKKLQKNNSKNSNEY
ncbi:MAG: VTT domain-containing protein [bacterium]|nr:VTT domain-containing protein [bacterium]